MPTPKGPNGPTYMLAKADEVNRCHCAECVVGRAAARERLGPAERPDFAAIQARRVKYRQARRRSGVSAVEYWNDMNEASTLEPHVAEVEGPLSLNVEES
jgi:hypothetical protein